MAIVWGGVWYPLKLRYTSPVLRCPISVKAMVCQSFATTFTIHVSSASSLLPSSISTKPNVCQSCGTEIDIRLTEGLPSHLVQSLISARPYHSSCTEFLLNKAKVGKIFCTKFDMHGSNVELLLAHPLVPLSIRFKVWKFFGIEPQAPVWRTSSSEF